MKNAFLILAHADPEHLDRLVTALDHESDVFVHVDGKSDLAAFDSVRRHHHVRFIDARVQVAWAGISMVDAILALMRAAMASGERYGHVGVLTGADYPLKSAAALHALLAAEPEREFIRLSAVRESPQRYLKLVERRHFREPWFGRGSPVFGLADRALRKSLSALALPNPWRREVVPYRGHTWCAITAACCRYIVEFDRDNPWYHTMNRHTFAPDEHYFHTLIGNSRFAMRATIQPCQGGLYPMASTHLIDASLTKWFTAADWPLVRESEKFFLRKVRSQDGRELLDLVDREMRAAPFALAQQPTTVTKDTP